LLPRLIASPSYCFPVSLLPVSALGRYGDIDMTTPRMRAFAAFHILLSVSWLAGLISRVRVLRRQRGFQLSAARMISKQLDENLVRELDRDGRGNVDKVEFVVGMLIAMGAQLCGQEINFERDVTPLIERFEALDADGSGQLSSDDLEFMIASSQKANSKVMANTHLFRSKADQKTEQEPDISVHAAEALKAGSAAASCALGVASTAATDAVRCGSVVGSTVAAGASASMESVAGAVTSKNLLRPLTSPPSQASPQT
jgi:hypothetical protein